jgi:hypothetical protein
MFQQQSKSPREIRETVGQRNPRKTGETRTGTGRDRDKDRDRERDTYKERDRNRD